jgi:hypothetical protein
MGDPRQLASAVAVASVAAVRDDPGGRLALMRSQYRVDPLAGWDACETINVFRFKGFPPHDIIRFNADCTLRRAAPKASPSTLCEHQLARR